MTDHSASAEQRASCMREAAHLEATVLYSSQDLGRQLPKTIELYTQHGHLAIEVQPPTLSELVPLIVHEELQQQHAVNTSVYCMALTRLIYGNDERKIALIGVAGLVHDIGETRVPKQLLEKDLTLTGEWEETKRHCQYGLDIVDKIDSVPAEVRAAIGQHHENFAGEGYPNNLKGEQIHPAARIVSICDIFDMLTTTRPDHDALTPAEALKLMDSMQPGRFDPQMFARFIKNG
jgi:HD-GYP domain-containing protein (c-di-GMP phosphodiesterase class II)